MSYTGVAVLSFIAGGVVIPAIVLVALRVIDRLAKPNRWP